MNKRPLTQNEIKKSVENLESEPRISVTNMDKHMLVLQIREPGSDFFIGERSVYIKSGKTFTERKSLFNQSQISNLRSKGKIKVL